MRAFIAIELSDEVRAALMRAIDELRRSGHGAKWVEPQNLHLTLKFLGSIPDDSVERVVELMRRCVAGIAPFRMEVCGAGGFPSLARPRVIYAGARDDGGRAAELARRLDEAMVEIGVARERRGFKGHITLARIRKPGPLGRLGALLEEMRERDFGVMAVGHIALMRSELTPDGPIYTRLDVVGLGAAEG